MLELKKARDFVKSVSFPCISDRVVNFPASSRITTVFLTFLSRNGMNICYALTFVWKKYTIGSSPKYT